MNVIYDQSDLTNCNLHFCHIKHLL